MDGEVDLFNEQGLYDGLFLLADSKTGTYWNHMTGEALYGPLAGKRLELENVLHTTVEQVLAQDPDALIAISNHPQAVMRTQRTGTLAALLSRIVDLPDIFPPTIAEEDDRRARMEIGIGIWTEEGAARYYSQEALEANERVLFDTFQGRRVLVYNDPTAHAFQALYSDADRAWWEGNVLRLDNGQRIEKGVLFGPDGSRIAAERPLQVFTRWYGFSLTFPQTEIYQGG